MRCGLRGRNGLLRYGRLCRRLLCRGLRLTCNGLLRHGARLLRLHRLLRHGLRLTCYGLLYHRTSLLGLSIRLLHYGASLLGLTVRLLHYGTSRLRLTIRLLHYGTSRLGLSIGRLHRASRLRLPVRVGRGRRLSIWFVVHVVRHILTSYKLVAAKALCFSVCRRGCFFYV